MTRACTAGYESRGILDISLPETIKKKSTFRAKALRRELVVTPDEGPSNSRRSAFARNVDFSFIVSDSERTFTFRVSLNTLPTLATLVRHVGYVYRALTRALFLVSFRE